MNILVIDNDFDIDMSSHLWDLLKDKFGIKAIYTPFSKRDKTFDYFGFKTEEHNVMILLGCMYYSSASLIPDLLKQHEILIFENHVIDEDKYESISQLIVGNKTNLKEVYACHYESSFEEYLSEFSGDKLLLNKAASMVDFYGVTFKNKIEKYETR